MTIRSRMSSIMDLIGQEHLELFVLDLKNCYIALCLHSSIYKYQAMGIKLSQIRSLMFLVLGLIGRETKELFALELKKLLYFTMFTI